jgi:hypothetical protein
VFDFQSQRELCQAQGRGVPMSDEIGRRGSVLPVMPTTSAVNLVIAAIPKHLAVGSPHLFGWRQIDLQVQFVAQLPHRSTQSRLA